jgi:hypothetical protein
MWLTRLRSNVRIELISISRVRQSFFTELDNPTLVATGAFVDGPSRN